MSFKLAVELVVWTGRLAGWLACNCSRMCNVKGEIKQQLARSSAAAGPRAQKQAAPRRRGRRKLNSAPSQCHASAKFGPNFTQTGARQSAPQPPAARPTANSICIICSPFLSLARLRASGCASTAFLQLALPRLKSAQLTSREDCSRHNHAGLVWRQHPPAAQAAVSCTTCRLI